MPGYNEDTMDRSPLEKNQRQMILNDFVLVEGKENPILFLKGTEVKQMEGLDMTAWEMGA